MIKTRCCRPLSDIVLPDCRIVFSYNVLAPHQLPPSSPLRLCFSDVLRTLGRPFVRPSTKLFILQAAPPGSRKGRHNSSRQQAGPGAGQPGGREMRSHARPRLGHRKALKVQIKNEQSQNTSNFPLITLLCSKKRVNKHQQFANLP